MQLPKRKSNRLSSYNYSQYGTYFLTICTEEKKPILCRIQQNSVFEKPQIILSPYGKIVDKKIKTLSVYYPYLHMEHYVVMPNHVHLLLSITKEADSLSNAANHTIPALISALKRFTNKEAGISLWHRSYYDHVIRNDSDFQTIWKYIDDNPAKWLEDRLYISEP